MCYFRGDGFTKRLREGVRNGTITCSIRIWKSPRVKVGYRYRMENESGSTTSLAGSYLRIGSISVGKSVNFANACSIAGRNTPNSSSIFFAPA